MRTAAVNEGRKPGRPRKYGQGRINATVRFTPKRYAELRAEADKHGRSVSEQVEHEVEQAGMLRKLIAQLRKSLTLFNEGSKAAVERMNWLQERHAAELENLKAAHVAELENLKAAAYAIEVKQLTEIVETAVARALMRGNR